MLVPQTCPSSSKCCFTKVIYGKDTERGCTDDTMIGNFELILYIHYVVYYPKVFIWTDFDEIENKCKGGYPGVGHEHTLCRGVCKRDLPTTGETSNACHVSITQSRIFFAMLLTLLLK